MKTRNVTLQHIVPINSELSHTAALERKGQDLRGGTEIEEEEQRRASPVLLVHNATEKWASKERD